MKKNLNKKGGFTLIEILVVIGIIAILAAIVIIAINPAKQFAQARNTQRTANVNAILNAVGQRIADNKGIFEGKFDYLNAGVDTVKGTADDVYNYYCPIITDDATADNVLTTDGDLADITDENGKLGCLVPTYISVLPNDPTWTTGVNTLYTIQKNSNGRITVCAPEAANENAIADAETICVTR